MKQGILRLVGISLALAFLSGAPLVHADVNNFTVTSFTADDTLTKADPQGELHVVEHINVDFTDFNHGILRAIPSTYKKHRLQLHVNAISSDTGAPVSYSTYAQNGNTVLKIGDPSRTVTSSQEYTIDYTVRNVISFYGDHDELYWNINGDQWAQPFDNVRVTLHLPSDLQLSSQHPICYTGTYGSLVHNCFVEQPATNVIVAQTTQGLGLYETLSTVVGFRKSYFHPSQWYETLGEYTNDIIAFVLPVLLLGGTTGLFWFRHGRDPKGRGVIVPEYDAPDGLSPIEVGTLIDFRTDNKDITATIIDLAIRRYLTIIEEKQDRKLGRSTTAYTLRLEKLDFSGLKDFEQKILNDLFEQSTVGQEVDLSYMKYKLSSTATVLRTTIRKSLIERHYFRPSAFTSKNLGIGFGVLCGLIAAGVLAAHLGTSGTFGVGVFIGTALAIIFFSKLSARTATGVSAKEHIEGLKLYLKVAEADRIKKLQSPDAPYAEKSSGPKRTVDLFEKLLPYAMVLGVEQQWAKQFEDIYRTPPDWYSGNWTAFNVLYLTESLSGVGQQVNSAFSAPSNASGSGFGGGGAGGGGGGGGGGGW
jgi:hypothetical protein